MLAFGRVMWAPVALALALPAMAQQSADWPQWRGISRDDISRDTHLLKQWPENGPALLWKATGLGKGYSGIAIVANRAYTMGDIPTADGGTKQHVIAIDLSTHKIVWTAPVGPPHDDGPRGTPTVVQGSLYVIGTSGDLVCMDATNGSERWHKNIERDLGGQMMSMWKFSESPLVDGDKVVCTPGTPQDLMCALNRRTGAVIWKTQAPGLGGHGKDGAGYSSIVPAEIGGVRQYVQFTGRGVVGVRASDGKLLWRSDAGTNDVANITTPLVKGNEVFVSSAYGAGSALLRITGSGDAFKADTVYALPAGTFQNHHGGLVLIDGKIYGGHGQNNGAPTCLDWATGKILWQERTLGGGSAAVTCADGKLYFTYENGVAALVDVDPTGMKLRGRFQTPPMPAAMWAHPTVLNGHLYIRHNDALFCYDVKEK